MSNYKAGDIIRLTRESMGMSQEELCENICSTHTLSRIENGKHSVKRSTYEQLMERMGRNGKKSFAAITVDDFDVMNIMAAADVALIKHEYEKLKEYVEILKPQLKDNVINCQYIRRKELIADYKRGIISINDYISGLEELLSLTVTDYNSLLDKVYPFFEQEISILISISNGYANLKDYKRRIIILDMLLRCINTGYMDTKNTIKLKIIILNNMAKGYGDLEEHQKAIDIAQKTIMLAKENKLVNTLPNLYAELAWNMLQQIERGEREKKEEKLCEMYLRQGRAIASLYRKNRIKYEIESIFEDYFK